MTLVLIDDRRRNGENKKFEQTLKAATEDFEIYSLKIRVLIGHQTACTGQPRQRPFPARRTRLRKVRKCATWSNTSSSSAFSTFNPPNTSLLSFPSFFPAPASAFRTITAFCFIPMPDRVNSARSRNSSNIPPCRPNSSPSARVSGNLWCHVSGRKRAANAPTMAKIPKMANGRVM